MMPSLAIENQLLLVSAHFTRRDLDSASVHIGRRALIDWDRMVLPDTGRREGVATAMTDLDRPRNARMAGRSAAEATATDPRDDLRERGGGGPQRRASVKAWAAMGLMGLLAAAGAGRAPARSDVQSTKVVVEEPTIFCLGVRWYIAGDEDGDAAVSVAYRRKGQAEWREGLPLFRVGIGPDGAAGEDRLERPEGAEGWPFEVGNLFAGSVFDLEPDTVYEIKLELSDPDGGLATELVEARTRAVPVAPPPKRELHVAPGNGGGAGSERDPLRGLSAANAAARPGDLVLLGDGVYEGTFVTDKSGDPGLPIVWRGDGEAVIDGAGAERGVSATDIHDVFFERLTIRNSQFGMVAHRSSDIVVRACHFYANDYGFTGTSNAPVMKRFYIADNLFEGPSMWPRTKGIEDARAIQVCGEGHVVCHNRVRGFGDGIDIMYDTPNRAIDFYANEISECTDDAIEMDYGQSNVRAFANRITNCFEGVSTQPLYGGPCYIIRNAMYNVEYTPFKMHNNPSGVLLLHNTAVKTGVPWPLYTSAEVRRCISRNNLFVGTAAGYALEFSPRMTDSDLDYDGFAEGPFARFARWGAVKCDTLGEFQSVSGMEQHGMLLRGPIFASGLRPPVDFKRQFSIAANDLRLAPDSAAIDAAVLLPNINDAYRGDRPDLGAYECGQPLPGYGPPAGR
jgi:hypothetical protein